MSVRLPQGWDVMMAVNADTPILGRVFMMFSTSWLKATNPGYDENQAAHDVLLADIIAWLTEGKSACSVLIVSATPIADATPFGSEFQAALTRLGHTSTVTGGATFNGYDPLSYDFICTSQLSETDANVDAYLDANGRVLGLINVYDPSTWERYGLSYSGYQDPKTANLTFYCSVIGATHYSVSNWWGLQGAAATKTRPGTTTFYNNDNAQKCVATWEA